MPKHLKQRVVFQPAASRRMLRGINQMADVLSATLGPTPRYVAIERPTTSSLPELLDNGGVIARRLVELPDRDEDMGAMLLRNLVWRLNDEVGDGTATAAVLFRAIYRNGIRYIAAGGNAMALRHHLESGLSVMLEALNRQVVQVQGKERLAQVAESICHDAPLAAMLGEIFDIIGEHGRLEIKDGHSRELEREYVDGMYWDSGALSPHMLPDGANQTVNLEEAAILLTDLEIDDPYTLVPILEMVIEADLHSLVIVARHLSSQAIALLLLNQQKRENFRVLAVRTPGVSDDEKALALEDMAIAVGGHTFLQAAGQTLRGVTVEDFGYARQAWANTAFFGIAGGMGNPRDLRSHLLALRGVLRQIKDPDKRKPLQQRLGRLMGGSATLYVGGTTKTEMDARREVAQRTADALRGAVTEGVLPGGGVALLACREALQQKCHEAEDDDERAAYQMLIEAAETPICTILANAGVNVGKIMARIDYAGAGYGYDVRTEQILNVAEAGILDISTVQSAALRCAVSGAGLALTIDVLVHRKQRDVAMG